MAVSPAVIKAIATAATDKRTWKAVAVLIAAIFMPIIIVILMIISIFSGVESANKNLLDYSFFNAEISADFTDEQRGAIENMRDWLSELDKEISEKENGDFDENLVRAAFYCLNFGENIDEDFDYDAFCECFKDLHIKQLETALRNISEEFPQYKITGNLSVSIKKVYDYLEVENDDGGSWI